MKRITVRHLGVLALVLACRTAVAPKAVSVPPLRADVDIRAPSTPSIVVAVVGPTEPSCVEPRPQAEPDPPNPALDAWLAWGSRLPLAGVAPTDPAHSDLEDVRERVIIARYGAGRITVDGAAIGDGAGVDAGAHEAVVLETDPSHRRVRVAVRGLVDLFLWVDASDLLPVPIRVARLRPVHGRAAGENAGVWLAPGRVLLPNELSSRRVRVEIEETAASYWLSSSAIGHVYRPAAFATPEQDRFVLIEGPVLVAPEGPALAHYDPEHLGDAFRLLRREGTWRLVEIVDGGGDLRVRGYVRAARLQRSDAWGAAHFLATPYRSAYRIEPPPAAGHRRLEPGATLTTSDGDLVAFVSGYRSIDLPDCGDDTVALETAWGVLELRVGI